MGAKRILASELSGMFTQEDTEGCQDMRVSVAKCASEDCIVTAGLLL